MINNILGRLTQSDSRRFQFACSQENHFRAQIGDLVQTQTSPDCVTYGLIADINWLADEMVIQMSRAATIAPNLLADSRRAGQILTVVVVGYQTLGKIIYALPPRPASCLEQVSLCQPQEVIGFTHQSLAYLRLVLDPASRVSPDVVAVHLVSVINCCRTVPHDCLWTANALKYLTEIMSANYDGLVSILESYAQTRNVTTRK